MFALWHLTRAIVALALPILFWTMAVYNAVKGDWWMAGIYLFTGFFFSVYLYAALIALFYWLRERRRAKEKAQRGSHAIGYAMHSSRSHDAVIRVLR